MPRIPQHLRGYFFLRLTRHPNYGRFSAIYDIRETIKETSGADLLAGSRVFDVAVGSVGNKLRFVPDTLNISVGDTVRWTWSSDNHSVTSGTPCTADEQFCSPDNMNCDTGILSNTGFVYEHTLTQAGSYSYFCALHCFAGMIGVINVTQPSRPHPTPRPRPTPHPRPVSPQ